MNDPKKKTETITSASIQAECRRIEPILLRKAQSAASSPSGLIAVHLVLTRMAEVTRGRVLALGVPPRDLKAFERSVVPPGAPRPRRLWAWLRGFFAQRLGRSPSSPASRSSGQPSSSTAIRQ